MRLLVRVMTAALLVMTTGAGIAVPTADDGQAGAPTGARANDPDALVKRMYDVLSGAPGVHDWDAFAALFHERAIMGASATTADGGTFYRISTPAEYMERTRDFFRTRDFRVKEIHRITEEFGDTVHVFSSYEFRVEGGGQPGQRGRGINSIQLVRDRDRWWIISIQFTNERPDLPMPKRYAGS